MTALNFNLKIELTASDALLETVRLIARASQPAEAKPAEAPAKPAEKKQEAEAPAKPAPKMEVADPLEIPEPVTLPTAQDVREAMQKVRNKFEYGECAEGEEKGSNETPDSTIHKALTRLFKEMAQELEPGKVPSELTGENKAIFIERTKGITLIEGDLVAPF